MFKDARARRAWGLYFLKAEAVLSPVATPVRRELLDDLKAHVQDILANEKAEGDELARLNAALERVGNPKEFLAPLIADAVFKLPPQQRNIGMAYRTLRLYAARGTTYLLRSLALATVAATGVVTTLAALNSLLRPDRAGLFQISGDEWQVRVMGFGEAAGEQMLAPWMALVLIAAGLAILVWTARRIRRMLMELIASAI